MGKGKLTFKDQKKTFNGKIYSFIFFLLFELKEGKKKMATAADNRLSPAVLDKKWLLTTGCHQPFWTKNGC